MWHAGRTFCFVTIAFLGLIGSPGAQADLTVYGGVDPNVNLGFGPNGDIGFVNSPPTLGISYGSDGQGSVYQMGGFVNVQGMNFNSDVGNSADLSYGPPAGIGFQFSASQPSPDQLLLTYQLTNNTGAALPGFQFLHYVDPDDGTNYPYEYATVNGLSNLGQNSNPTSFQVSDASYGTIFTNLGTGMLSDNDDLPNPSQVGDVSAALGFNVGSLGIGQSATIEILLSDNGTTLNNFFITQGDPLYPGDSLTISGSVVPEPRSLVLLAIGSLLGVAPDIWRRVRARAQAWTRSQ
jgi:hypothetical protein